MFVVEYESKVITTTALVNFPCSTDLALICRDLVAFMGTIILWFDVRLSRIQTDWRSSYSLPRNKAAVQSDNSVLLWEFHNQLHILVRSLTSAFRLYNRINSTKSLASGAGNMREGRLMIFHGREREVVRAYISVQSWRWWFQCSSAYVAAAIMWMT